MNKVLHRRAFTLVELMIVSAILAILMSIVGTVIANAKSAAKKSTCMFNLRQMGSGVGQYVIDYDDVYPQTKVHGSPQPEIDDADGSLEKPDRGSMLVMLGRYSSGIADCPSDPDASVSACSIIDPTGPDTNSYVVNAYFAFGLKESMITYPPETIFASDRRSMTVDDVPAVCDDVYHPWWNPKDLVAPRNDMDALTGAIATKRHMGGANYAFADTHAAWFEFGQTWNLDLGIDWHTTFR